MDPTRLRETGWGIIVTEGGQEPILAALGPLIDYRNRQAEGKVKIFTVPPDMPMLDFLCQNKVARGVIRPESVPYYLLIAAPPDRLGFAFQSGLDAEYATGRLTFDDPADYRAYAERLLDFESRGAGPDGREALFWAPEVGLDRETMTSAGWLAQPLHDGFEPLEGMPKRLLRGGDATQAALVAALHGPNPPALLFTAAHGLSYTGPHPEQRARQGALVAQGWQPQQPVPDDCLFWQSNVSSEASLRGLVHFAFASFSAGTRDWLALPGQRVAPEGPEFVAALPQRMLTRGAMAFVGHTGSVWSYPFLEASGGLTRGRTLAPYALALEKVARGDPVGHALRELHDDAVLLSASLIEDVEEINYGGTPNALSLMQKWTARENARSAVLLGDPAARLASREKVKFSL